MSTQIIERWRPIPGVFGYEVSDLGRVRSYRVRGRHDTTHLNSVPRVLRTRTRQGYKRLGVLVDGVTKNLSVHRLVLDVFVGPCPPGQQAAHLNGRRDDNRLVNLAWKTPKDNQADRVEHGTDVRGEKSIKALLSADQVRRIRQMSGSLYQRQLATMFGVSRSTIENVVLRKSWRHVS